MNTARKNSTTSPKLKNFDSNGRKWVKIISHRTVKLCKKWDFFQRKREREMTNIFHFCFAINY